MCFTLPKTQTSRILVVEDEPLIALDLMLGFEEAGLTVVGVAPDVDIAMRMIADDPPDMATLDYNLGNQTCSDVAHLLDRLDIPFVYVTAQLIEREIGVTLPVAPLVRKPARLQDILQRLAA